LRLPAPPGAPAAEQGEPSVTHPEDERTQPGREKMADKQSGRTRASSDLGSSSTVDEAAALERLARVWNRLVDRLGRT
jgi:hypothetical protein